MMRYFPLYVASSILGFAFTCQAEEWSWRAPTGGTGGNSIFGAAYSPQQQKILAVDLGGNVLTKTGSNPWQSSRLPGIVGLESAHWTGRHFIIRGEDDRPAVRPGGWVALSKNGVGWKRISALQGQWLVRGFASSPEITVAIAASLTLRNGVPAGPIIFYSEDAARNVWKRAKLPVMAGDRPAFSGAVAYADNRFVALLDNDAVLVSADGKTWTKAPADITSASADTLVSSPNRFVVLVLGEIFQSADGSKWDAVELPEELYYVSKCIPTASGFLVVQGGETAFFTEDFRTWRQLPAGEDWSWLLSATSDEHGGLYLFGSGGRIKYYQADSSLATVVDPGGLGGDFGQPFRFFAGSGSTFFAADQEGNKSYRLAAGGRWQPIVDGLEVDGRPRPRSFHQVANGVVAVAGEPDASLYVYDNNSWRVLGPAPALEEAWQIVSVALAPDGKALVLARAYAPSGSSLRYRLYLSPPGLREWEQVHFSESPGDLDAEERVEHDGRRFVAVLNPGRLLVSESGVQWSELPPIPEDQPSFLKRFYRNYFVPAANEPRSFASNGNVLVAASSKLEYSTDGQTIDIGSTAFIQRFFAYSFSTGKWKPVVAPGDTRVAFSYPAVIRWNGSFFLAASRDGSLLSPDYEGGSVYTSPDGYNWTPWDFPVGGNLLDLVWTGGEFAAVTFGSSVLTHPGDLSSFSETSSVRDRIIFPAIPPKIFGSPPFVLPERSAAGRAQFYDIESTGSDAVRLDGNLVTIRGVGPATIEASVPDSPLASPVERSFSVRPLQQRLAVTAPPKPPVGVPFEITVRSNSETVPQFSSKPPDALTIQSIGPASRDRGSFARTFSAVARVAGRIELETLQPGDTNLLASKPARSILLVRP